MQENGMVFDGIIGIHTFDTGKVYSILRYSTSEVLVPPTALIFAGIPWNSEVRCLS